MNKNKQQYDLLHMSMGGDLDLGSDGSEHYGAADDSGNYSSVSSQGQFSGDHNYTKMISDFKHAIQDRRTPVHLVVMGRLMIAIIMLTIALSAIIFSSQVRYADDSLVIGEQLVD